MAHDTKFFLSLFVTLLNCYLSSIHMAAGTSFYENTHPTIWPCIWIISDCARLSHAPAWPGCQVRATESGRKVHLCCCAHQATADLGKQCNNHQRGT